MTWDWRKKNIVRKFIIHQSLQRKWWHMFEWFSWFIWNAKQCIIVIDLLSNHCVDEQPAEKNKLNDEIEAIRRSWRAVWEPGSCSLKVNSRLYYAVNWVWCAQFVALWQDSNSAASVCRRIERNGRKKTHFQFSSIADIGALATDDEKGEKARNLTCVFGRRPFSTDKWNKIQHAMYFCRSHTHTHTHTLCMPKQIKTMENVKTQKSEEKWICRRGIREIEQNTTQNR